MKTWQEKQRDAARLAEAERIAEEEEREQLEFAIEAEQCAFVDAADAIASVLLDHGIDTAAVLSDVDEELSKVLRSKTFFASSFIWGLWLVLDNARSHAASDPSQKHILLVMLEAMAAHDPTRDAGPGSGQIERQAKECREALDESDS